MENNPTCLFVYGSLRQGFGHPAFEYISRYFSPAGDARARATMHDLGDYPAAIPSTADYWVKGELYCVKHEDEFWYAIAQLDDYEGAHPEEGEPLYTRQLTVAQRPDGSEVMAWVYWYHGDIGHLPLVESGDALEYFKQKRG